MDEAEQGQILTNTVREPGTMIIQKMKSGKHEIRIEIAESIQDAKKNNFTDGEYTRYFVDNKNVQYSTMIKFIVDETKNNKERFAYDDATLINLRKQMIENQNKEQKKNLEELKKQYQRMGVSSQVMKVLDDAINKIDLTGMRSIQ